MKISTEAGKLAMACGMPSHAVAEFEELLRLVIASVPIVIEVEGGVASVGEAPDDLVVEINDLDLDEEPDYA